MSTYSYNLPVIKKFLDQCKTEFVDIVCVSDSNGLFGGTGWDTGLVRMLQRMYPDKCYSSGLFGFGEGNSVGVGHGVGTGALGSDSDLTSFRAGASGGGQDDRAGSAPAFCKDFWSTDFDTGNGSGVRNTVLQETYWASTTSPRTHPALYNGLRLCDKAPVGTSLDAAHQIQYQVWLAKFTAASAPNLTSQPFFFLKNGSLVSGGIQNFATGSAASDLMSADSPFTFTYPVNSTPVNSSGIEARWNGTASQQHHYPFYAAFQRFVRSNALSGWGSQHLYACGGSHSGNAYDWINTLDSTKLSNYFSCVTYQARAVESPFQTLVWIVLGANDVTASRTKAQFKTSIENLIIKIRTAWVDFCGFDQDRIAFAIMVDHQRTIGKDDQEDYRKAAMEIAVEDQYKLVASVDLNECISYDALDKNFASSAIPTYDLNNSDSGRSHLKVTSSALDSYTNVSYLLANLLDGSTSLLSENISTPIIQAGAFRMRTGLTSNLSYKLGV